VIQSSPDAAHWKRVAAASGPPPHLAAGFTNFEMVVLSVVGGLCQETGACATPSMPPRTGRCSGRCIKCCARPTGAASSRCGRSSGDHYPHHLA
jgi:hypothetical protein